MVLIKIESKGDITSLKNEDTGFLSIIGNGVEKDLIYKNNNLSYETNKFIFLGAEYFFNYNNVALKNKKTNNIFSFKFNKNWKFPNIWGSNYLKVLKEGKKSFYDYEELYFQDFNGDGEVGVAFTDLEVNGNINLIKDSLSNLYVLDYPFEIPIKYKNGTSFKYLNGKYTAVAAEHNGGINYIVQKHSVSNNLKIFYSDSGDWNFKKNDFYFEKNGTYEYYDAELFFGVDFNEDQIIGYNLETIEENGSQYLKKDSQENLYIEYESLTKPLFYKNSQLKNNIFSNKIPISIEIVDGIPGLLFENKNGNLNLWTFDEEYSFELSKLINYQSSKYFEIESLFSQDIDGDNKVGFSYSQPIEGEGSVYIVSDQIGNLYTQSLEQGFVVDTDPISYKGDQISNGFFNGFTILGAEKINNINYLALLNKDNGLKIYSADEEWNLLKSSFINSETNSYFQAEENFQQDFDGDGIIGYNFLTPFDNFGDIFLVKDQVDNIYSYEGKVADSKKNPIIYKGKQLNEKSQEFKIGSIFKNFDLLGAEKFNDQNHLALESVFSGDLAIWKLNDKWNYNSFEKVKYQTKDYYFYESDFNQDFNGDQIIGLSYSNVETEGKVDLLLNDQFGDAYVSSTLEDDPSMFSNSAVFQKEAITYKGLNVSESDEFSIFGDSLIAAETINSINKVAWKKSNGDLTIWEMKNGWEFANTTNIEFQSYDYFKNEVNFNLDLNDDGNIGLVSTIVESDKFVELITDSSGAIILKLNGIDKEILPLYNSEEINLNDFSNLIILAADTNLYKNKIVNQLAWAEVDAINNIKKIQLWEMDKDWNFISSETISKHLQENIINPLYQLQELGFDTDFDQEGDIGNGFLGFYPFSLNNESTDLNGNTFLKKKTLDNSFVAESAESTWEIKINNLALKNSFNFEDLEVIKSLMTKYDLDSGDFGKLEVLAAEQIDGKNKLLLGNESSIFIFEADLNWVLNTKEIDFYSTNFLNSNIGIGIQNYKFYEQEILFKQDLDSSGNIGINSPLEFSLEQNGFSSVFYDKSGNYAIYIPSLSKSLTPYIDNIQLNKKNFPEVNLISIEAFDSDLDGIPEHYLLTEEKEKIKLYSTVINPQVASGKINFKQNDELVGQGLLWEKSINDFLISDGLEGLEYLFKQDFNANKIIGKYKYLDIFGDTALIKDTDNKLSVLSVSNLDFDLNIGINIKNTIDISKLSSIIDPTESKISNSLISLVKNNKQIVQHKKNKWNILAAESISEENKILLQHKKNNNIKVWEFDNNWNYKKSSKVYKKAEKILYNENLFDFDINNDGIIGEKFEKLELNGDVQMLKDQSGFLYSKIDSLGNPISITNKNKKVKFDNLNGLQVVCIDNINGNKVVTKNKKNNVLKIWEADDSWALKKSGKSINYKNDLFFEEEINFDTDFDQDGHIGFVLEDIESENLILQKNQNGNCSVIINSQNKYLTNKKNNNINFKKPFWEIAAAEIVSDINKVVLKNNNNNKIKIWSMDENWKFSNIDSKLKKSNELFFEKESLFGCDFDNDGKIGLIHSQIEKQGLILQKNQIGNVSILDGNVIHYLKDKQNKKVKFENGKWNIIGAETINNVNLAVWKHLGNGNLKLWTMDENFNYINQSKILSNTKEYFDLQDSFDQIF